MRKNFLGQLETLKEEIIEMGGLNESALQNALEALYSGDARKADKAMRLELAINQKERDIEKRCMDLLLLEHPVASDLRMVSAAMKMITDMERIGDQAADIAEISQMSAAGEMGAKILQEMAGEVMIMVKGSIDAFVGQNLSLAQGVIDRDDVVDHCFLTVRSQISCMLQQNINDAPAAIDLIMIAKYLERIADHSSNIAEWVLFAITGEHPKEKTRAD